MSEITQVVKPLYLRGRKPPVYAEPLPCNHDFTAFMPLEDYLTGLTYQRKRMASCSVRYCLKCGMVSGVMW